MPAAFVSSEPTIQTLGNDIVRDVQRFTYQALPSGVVYSFVLAPAPVVGPQNVGIPSSVIDYGTPGADPTVVHGTAEDWANRWNDNFSQPGVLAIITTQEVGPSGHLEDVCYVTVASTSGRSTTQIRGDSFHFYAPAFDPWVAAARAQLDEIEAMTPDAPVFGV